MGTVLGPKLLHWVKTLMKLFSRLGAGAVNAPLALTLGACRSMRLAILNDLTGV